MQRSRPTNELSEDGGGQTSSSDAARRSKRPRKLPGRLQEAYDVPGGEELDLSEQEDSPRARQRRESSRGQGLHGNRFAHPNRGAHQGRPMHAATSDFSRSPGERAKLNGVDLEEVLTALVRKQAAMGAKVDQMLHDNAETSAALQTIAAQVAAIKQQLAPSLGGGEQRQPRLSTPPHMTPQPSSRHALAAGTPNRSAASWLSGNSRQSFGEQALLAMNGGGRGPPPAVPDAQGFGPLYDNVFPDM